MDASAGGVPPIAFLINLLNASGTTLTLQQATLAGGIWFATVPSIGDQILPGAARLYVNAPQQSFSGLGGTLLFAPATGGTITVGWSWPSGQMPQAAAYAQNTSLIVTGQLINSGTGQPDFQVQITPS